MNLAGVKNDAVARVSYCEALGLDTKTDNGLTYRPFHELIRGLMVKGGLVLMDRR